MTKLKRKYSQKTLKILFGLSGNQCAHPECTNPLIEPATEKSNDLVITQICHIYAISAAGPRGKIGLTEQELNSLENLILLCPNHHTVVDGQHESYPADMLREWKRRHESKMQCRLSTDPASNQPFGFPHPRFPTAVVDQEIENELDILRKSRFFSEFDRVRFSLALGRKLTEGELCGGTDAIRERALAWCARLLSRTEELEKAEEYLNLAKSLGTGSEISIADAFITSRKGDKNAALATLAGIDTPLSRSAALIIVAHHERAEGAVEWLKSAGVDAADLDPDGKDFLLALQLDIACWDAAREVLAVLTDQDLDETPILHHRIAITHLLSAVPVELRATVHNQLPFNVATFPLASDAAAMDTRRAARQHFTDAADVAQQLNCPEIAKLDDEYALWLELKDPETSDHGLQRLRDSLSDPKPALHLVHLGLQFGLKLDPAAVEKEINRQTALHGGITSDGATARFALAVTQKTPKSVADYITHYHNELSKYLDKKTLLFVQIEMLSQAGLPERANECLNLLLEDGLSEIEENRARRIISEAQGTDPVEARIKQFKQTDSLSDLAALVAKLEATETWGELCEYGRILFERTGDVSNAERLANALSMEQKSEQLLAFLRSNSALLAQSRQLRMSYCWSLYQEGALLEARSELAKLSDNPENPNYRALRVSIGIALGDWPSLSAYVSEEYQAKEQRSAQDLLNAAQLALHLASPDAKKLLFAAAEKGPDDAGVLATAYFLATNAGWDGEAEVAQWFHRAVTLSDDEGPLQRMTLKEIFDRKPEWDQRESETWRLLSCGEIPMFLAAQSLNRSLIYLTLFPALANLSELDPRRRSPIAAFSGKREPISCEISGSVGMDATALLTLSFLDLLDGVLDTFETIHVPHSTLAWIFQEKKQAVFHQPSRIRDAHRIRNLLATDSLEKFVSSTRADGDLSTQVGDELAMLIAEAEMTSVDDAVQRLVVRPYPVHRLSPLIEVEEKADLTAHAAVLSSCQAIVDTLRTKGQLTTEEVERARAYLQQQEEPWPNQPEITDGAVLYLDNLTVAYFLHLGILEKLKTVGFRSIASPRTVSEANQLISYESISGEVGDALERIRSALSSRIESGKVKVDRQDNIATPEEIPLSERPTFSVISLVRNCNVIISDDRFLNQHKNIADSRAQVLVFSTLDVLDLLTSAGVITLSSQLEYRTQLRRAGYFFVPVREDELAAYLAAATVKDSKVIETAELKAIRESILHVRMNNWLQLPQEEPWLKTTLRAFIQSLKGLWVSDADLSGVTARSNWLMDQLDVRGWAQSLGPENGDNFVESGRGAYILMTLTPPFDAPQEVKNAYWSWVEDRVLAPIKEQYPSLYAQIVGWHRRQISEMANTELTEEGTT